MPDAAQLRTSITLLLARTCQHPYPPDVIALASDVVAGWGQAWTARLDSPASLAELPLPVAGCLLAYAAALQEDGCPDLTARRLEREADARSRRADWHARQAAELAGKAGTSDTALRDAFLGSAAAHAECARQARADAAQTRAIAAALASPDAAKAA